MPLDILIIIFALFSIGSFLIMDGHLINVISGFVLFSNGVNVYILALSGAPEGKSAPILNGSLTFLVDPLPQALILTAIVIGFGMLAFLAALAYQVAAGRQK